MLQQTVTHHFPSDTDHEVAYCGHRRADDERGSGAPTCPTCADRVAWEDRLDAEIAETPLPLDVDEAATLNSVPRSPLAAELFALGVALNRTYAAQLAGRRRR